MTPVRWGILSTAKVAVHKAVPGMLKSRELEVVGIASRRPEAAEAAAAALGLPAAYGSYEELLADASIEAVYNPLPNPQHVPWTLAAARAGKHVLCEKPMALSAPELDALRPYAGQVHLREAFMVRHHPQWIEVREQLRRGAVGSLRYLQLPFSYYNDNPDDIRNRVDQGGGALYDIGCYAVVAGRWFFEAEPLRAAAMLDNDPAFGTDRLASGLLDFGGGRHLAFNVATQCARYQRIQLVGSRGRIEIEAPFDAPSDAACRYWIDDAGAPGSPGLRSITLPIVDQYQLQAEAFSRAVREEPPDAAALDDARMNARVLDALFTSARSGRFERPDRRR
jgi:predicted dehydrogenase